MAGPDAAHVGRDEVDEQLLLGRRELVEAQALVAELEVVAEGRRERLAGQVGARIARPRCASVRARISASPCCSSAPNTRAPVRERHRLRAHEQRRHDDLVAQDEAVDDQVVAVDLPAPGLIGRRRAEEAQPVEPLAVLLVAAGDLADQLVEPHDVARRVEAVRAEARAQERSARSRCASSSPRATRRGAGGTGGCCSSAARRRRPRRSGPAPLLGAERGEPGECRGRDGPRGDAGRPERENPGTTRPSVVMPLNGSAREASAVCRYF